MSWPQKTDIGKQFQTIIYGRFNNNPGFKKIPFSNKTVNKKFPPLPTMNTWPPNFSLHL